MLNRNIKINQKYKQLQCSSWLSLAKTVENREPIWWYLGKKCLHFGNVLWISSLLNYHSKTDPPWLMFTEKLLSWKSTATYSFKDFHVCKSHYHLFLNCIYLALTKIAAGSVKQVWLPLPSCHTFVILIHLGPICVSTFVSTFETVHTEVNPQFSEGTNH